MMLLWMLYSSAVTLLLAVAAWILEPTIRQRGWPVRWLWALSMLGSLLLPLLAAVLPFRRALPASAPPLPHADGAQPSAPLPIAEWNFWTEPLGAVAAPARNTGINSWLLALWVLTSALIALAIVSSYATFLRRCRRWTLREIDGRAVWVSPDTGPAVVGVFPGRIVIPEWVVGTGVRERTLILTHEEEHIRAGDPRLLFGTLLLATAFPWNVALWWTWRSLRRAVEIDCDLRVLARGADPGAYSRVLIDATERGTARHFAVAALSESPSFLERRIRLMLEPKARRGWARTGGASLVAIACVLAACGLQQPDQAETLVASAAAGVELPTAGEPPHPTGEKRWDVGPRQVAHFAGREAQENVDPEALAFCRNRALRAQRTHPATVLDSIDVEAWGRGDTVLVGGAIEWQNSNTELVRARWFCDMIRTDEGEWRQWHFGLAPAN